MNRLSKWMFIVVVALGVGGPLSANVIFSTDFSSATQAGGLDTPITMGGTVADEVTVGTLSHGAGVLAFRIDGTSLAGQATAPVFAAMNAGQNSAEISTLAKAVELDSFFQFTLSSDEPLPQFAGFSFNMVKHGFSQFAGATLRSSVDNYSSDLITVTDSTGSGVYPASVNLSSISGFKDLTSVTFRFYLYEEFSGTQARRLGVDDIQVSVIPEPATLGLVAVSCFGLIVLRRFRL